MKVYKILIENQYAKNRGTERRWLSKERWVYWNQPGTFRRLRTSHIGCFFPKFLDSILKIPDLEIIFGSDEPKNVIGRFSLDNTSTMF